eukprot:8538498-Karenia_brevis.AAC.1
MNLRSEAFSPAQPHSRHPAKQKHEHVMNTNEFKYLLVDLRSEAFYAAKPHAQNENMSIG